MDTLRGRKSKFKLILLKASGLQTGLSFFSWNPWELPLDQPEQEFQCGVTNFHWDTDPARAPAPPGSPKPNNGIYFKVH